MHVFICASPIMLLECKTRVKKTPSLIFLSIQAGEATSLHELSKRLWYCVLGLKLKYIGSWHMEAVNDVGQRSIPSRCKLP